MAKNSKIDWTDHTWNSWQGCHKVSPGCANCYMFRDKKRYGQDPSTVIRSKPATFNQPLHWKDPAKVFVCSWSDFFIEEADPWRDEAWDIMRKTPHLTYLLLTKRPERIMQSLPHDWVLPNVWLGVTAENQEQADKRIPYLDNLGCTTFVSVEPMLSFVFLNLSIDPFIDWVICGGESGPNARMMKPEWAESLKQQCNDAGVPFFMKQMSGTSKAQREAIPDYLFQRQFPK